MASGGEEIPPGNLRSGRSRGTSQSSNEEEEIQLADRRQPPADPVQVVVHEEPDGQLDRTLEGDPIPDEERDQTVRPSRPTPANVIEEMRRAAEYAQEEEERLRRLADRDSRRAEAQDILAAQQELRASRARRYGHPADPETPAMLAEARKADVSARGQLTRARGDLEKARRDQLGRTVLESRLQRLRERIQIAYDANVVYRSMVETPQEADQIEQTVANNLAAAEALDNSIVQFLADEYGPRQTPAMPDPFVLRTPVTPRYNPRGAPELTAEVVAAAVLAAAKAQKAAERDEDDLERRRKEQLPKLPDMHIQPFGGEESEYRAWRQSVDKLIDSRKEMGIFEKFSYLRGTLKGEALRKVNKFDMSDESYVRVKDMLEEEYGKQEHLVAGCLKTLFKSAWDTPTQDKDKLTRKYEDMLGSINTLRGVRIDIDNVSVARVFIPLLESQIPDKWVHDWMEIVDDREKDEHPSVEEFMKFFKGQLNTTAGARFREAGAQKPQQPMKTKKPDQQLASGTALVAGDNNEGGGLSKAQKRRAKKAEKAAQRAQNSTANVGSAAATGGNRQSMGERGGSNQSQSAPSSREPSRTRQELDEKQCVFCKGAHRSIDCFKGKRMTVNERWEIVKLFSVCWVCLRGGHRSNACPEKRPCGVDGCQTHHHPMLHNEQSRKD